MLQISTKLQGNLFIHWSDNTKSYDTITDVIQVLIGQLLVGWIKVLLLTLSLVWLLGFEPIIAYC